MIVKHSPIIKNDMKWINPAGFWNPVLALI